MKTSRRARMQRQKIRRTRAMVLSSRSKTRKSSCRRIRLGRRNVLLKVTSQAQRQLRKARARLEMTQQDRTRTLLGRLYRETTKAKAAPLAARARWFAVTSAVAQSFRHRAVSLPTTVRGRSRFLGKR